MSQEGRVVNTEQSQGVIGDNYVGGGVQSTL